jgi:PAS domain S-box-containing protein
MPSEKKFLSYYMKNQPTADSLQVSDEQFRITLASIGDAVISTDEAGRVCFMNPVAEELTGWRLDEAAGQPLENIFRIVDERTLKSVENPVTRVLRGGHVVGLGNHTLLVARDGTKRQIDDSAAPVREAGGPIRGVVLVFRDVGDRRRAELNTLRLGAIVEHSQDAIVGKDLNGIVRSWNLAAERIFGYTADEMVGQSIRRLLPRDRQHEEEEILARLRRGEVVQSFDSVRVRKDGQPIHVQLTISPIKDREGRIVGASKIARDLTIQREAQQRIEAMQADLAAHAKMLEARVELRTKELEEKVAELEAFSYSLSHDLRAPLRAITSFTQIVLADESAKLGDGSVDRLQRVINAALRMDRLIRDVLAFSRLSQFVIFPESVDVAKLADDLIHERPELQSPRAEIRIERPLLPMRGHLALLTQALGNLLDNAVKFVPRGVMPRVLIRTEPLGDMVRLWVEDNGIGITRDQQRRLFTLFQRLNPTGHYEGMGIGLAIVRKAAERMNGQAGVESEPGKGSRFWLQLPKA